MSEVERARTQTLEAQTRAPGHVCDSHRRTVLTDTDKALAAGWRREVTVLASLRKLGGNDNKSCYDLWIICINRI
jgi:hypothetical protein